MRLDKPSAPDTARSLTSSSTDYAEQFRERGFAVFPKLLGDGEVERSDGRSKRSRIATPSGESEMFTASATCSICRPTSAGWPGSGCRKSASS